jgi:hypothetical protein
LQRSPAKNFAAAAHSKRHHGPRTTSGEVSTQHRCGAHARHGTSQRAQYQQRSAAR